METPGFDPTTLGAAGVTVVILVIMLRTVWIKFIEVIDKAIPALQAAAEAMSEILKYLDSQKYKPPHGGGDDVR